MRIENYPDIYFEPDYAKLYESPESKAVEFKFECEFGCITNLFLQRKIGTIQNKIYYDIITPYGYGGPIIHKASDSKALVKCYGEAFQQYADREHIVSEFVRFHPIVGNAHDFEEVYSPIYDRKTIGTNLKFDDVIKQEFSQSKRKTIKKVLKNSDIHYCIQEGPDNIHDFIPIYYSTMDRDRAEKKYYFDRSYFDMLVGLFRSNIITGKVYFADQLIAMGVYFRYGDYLHAHLSGTLTEYLQYSPACILKYIMALYGHEKGYSLIHYGGGTTNSPNNGLYKFKREFGRNTKFDFYIARKVWNEEVYSELCRLSEVDPNSAFFPAYRINNTLKD